MHTYALKLSCAYYSCNEPLSTDGPEGLARPTLRGRASVYVSVRGATRLAVAQVLT